jgi:tartrate dehydrogenase/decarboxylase/D-malate dehydrogenase
MAKHKIALLPGDGVGPEVVKEGVKALKALEKVDSELSFTFDEFEWNSDYYLKNKEMMPKNGLDILSGYDAIFLGAIGDPRVPDHIGVGELIFKIRQGFNQYVNLRPIKLLEGVDTPLKDTENRKIDMVFIRENTEGEYGAVGGKMHENTPYETVIQANVFSRYGTERVMKYAFETALKRRKDLTSVTKSNALRHSMVFWDDVFNELKVKYPEVKTQSVLVDAMSMFMVKKPETFDVVVASNLFGDILTDLGAAITGGLGFAPGGNINPEKHFPSMFEPIHGSAPKYKGQKVVNPVATVWAAKLMLDHLGEDKNAQILMNAIEAVLRKGEVKTKDIGGKNSTDEMGDAIVDEILCS